LPAHGEDEICSTGVVVGWIEELFETLMRTFVPSRTGIFGIRSFEHNQHAYYLRLSGKWFGLTIAPWPGPSPLAPWGQLCKE
jgi:hypothetical protein